jgi:hypothetical protein
LRFNDGDSAYLSRSVGTPTSAKTGTFSFWAKKALNGTEIRPFGNYDDESNRLYFSWASSNSIEILGKDGGSITLKFVTTQVFRDPSAWYHVVFMVDVTQSTESDRCKLYVNGEQITDFSTATYPSQNVDQPVFDSANSLVGTGYSGSISSYFDGYLAEFYYIDGTALDASSFGETDAATNQWKPIEATGLTYGTNGFYQKYSATELANSFTDSAEGRVITANGNVHTDTTVKKIGTASAQFDGTGDYLYVDDSSTFKLGDTSASWTIEFWIRLTSAAADYIVIDHRASTMANGGFSFYTDVSAGGVGFDRSNGTTWSAALQDPTQNTLDTWYHYAVVQDGGSTLKMYRDGTEVDSTTTLMDDDSGTYINWFIGGGYNNAGSHSNAQYMNGYLDEIRVSDTARYTSAFTPSTTAFTNDANTMLLLHCDGSDGGTTFTDSSTSPRHTISRTGDVTNSRAQAKIGTSSIKFDGTGDYLSVPDSSDWNFGANNFTVECWVYGDIVTSDYQGIIGNWYGTASNYSFDFRVASADMSGNVVFAYRSDGGTNTIVDSGYQLSDNTWYHLAASRSSTNLYIFVDGDLKVTHDISTTTINDPSNDIVIGNTDGSYYWDGYADEIRISDSARYTSSFTPSTTEFTADSNTMLLIHSDFDGGLGADSSGNKNDFAVTNLVATDQMIDTPTNNYCTLNPLNLGVNTASSGKLSEGNLYYASYNGVDGYNDTYGTFSLESGKWYWEVEVVNNFSDSFFGICDPSKIVNQSYPMNNTGTIVWNCITGAPYIRLDNSDTTYGTQTKASNGDILGIAIDLDGETFEGFVNNVSQGSFDFSSRTVGSGVVVPMVVGYSASSGTSTFVLNFGQDSSFAGQKTAQGNGGDGEDFYYTPPSGYIALNTDNLPDPAIALPTDHFNTVLYSGNSSTQSITTVGFQPDFVTVKSRTAAEGWGNYDSVRGATKRLEWYSSGAEAIKTNGITSFDSSGFSMGDLAGNNATGQNYVSYNWKAGGTAVSNTDGSITSSVSANPTAGFSIISYTGVYPLDPATIGHGLSQKPELVIIKRTDAGANWWVVGSDALTSWGYWIALNDSGAEGSAIFFENTAPTASVIELRNDGDASVNGNTNTYVAYCFHSVEGYSKVGSYVGNGNADGTFIYTGIIPTFVLIKDVSAAEDWVIHDTARSTYNQSQKVLYPNSSGAEEDSSNRAIDIVSNGFKARNLGGRTNRNGNTYLYYVIGYPFKTSNAR